MEAFKDFVDRKQRQAVKHLEIISKLLESQGFHVSNFLKKEDPYIYVYNSKKDLSFEGIRVYEIGGMLSYRVQKEEETQPYGKAYLIPVETMFEDFLTDHKKPEGAAKQVIKAIADEVKRFFEQSLEAEKELRADSEDGYNGRSPRNPMNRIVGRVTGGPSWSNLVYNPR